MRCVVYILYFDEKSRTVAAEWTRGKTWAIPLFLPTTTWLESDAYTLTGVLMSRYHEWRDADYVGTLAYSAPQKVPHITSVVQRFVDHTNPSNPNSPDVLALNAMPHKNLLEQGSRCHPQFRALWMRLMPRVKCDPLLAQRCVAFFNNYWIARPAWMLRYMEFYQKCRHVVDTDGELQRLVWLNAQYRKQVTPLLRRVFHGRNYYPHHPFIAERLPSYFFYMEHARIATHAPMGNPTASIALPLPLSSAAETETAEAGGVDAEKDDALAPEPVLPSQSTKTPAAESAVAVHGTIPIVMIAYNNLTFVRSFVQQVRRLRTPIVILDNHSDYPALQQYYDTLERDEPGRFTIHRLGQNYGHKVFEKRPELLPDVYILSDPDLELNPAMPVHTPQVLLRLSQQFRTRRVGLALSLTDSHLFIKGAYGELVRTTERAYWKKRIQHPQFELYRAPLDTTFTLINRHFPDDPKQHVRVAGVFTARHLPWYDGYLAQHVPDEEMKYWRRNNISSSILEHIDPTLKRPPPPPPKAPLENRRVAIATATTTTTTNGRPPPRAILPVKGRGPPLPPPSHFRSDRNKRK